MVHQFRAHAVLTENLILIFRIKFGSSQPPVTLVPEDLTRVTSKLISTHMYIPPYTTIKINL